eukprot:TRINITY_DN80181_c0_g1_i1.p1 TRINITY_DN80181_c0_g1~~TRINITY_DN80181_c0_g1_i1.p1  ORF type:complete len:1028 (+),score=161.42 TRINITY_DN80181_c0_g1_i1:25-3084(+)
MDQLETLKHDRIRPKAYVQQLPRADREQVAAQESAEDEQALLNESWPQYCVGSKYTQERSREDRQKWVVETWDEYESRIIQRESAIKKFFDKQAAQEQMETRDQFRRNAAGDTVLELIKHRERKRKARLLPTLHTLLYDPEREAALQRQAEQEEILKKEEIERKIVLEESRKTLEGMRRMEIDSRSHIQAVMRRRIEEEEERKRKIEEQERHEREQREALRRKQEQDEQDKQARDRLIRSEDQARQRMLQDEIIERKEMEEKADAAAEAILREEEAAIARREIELKRKIKEDRARESEPDVKVERGRELSQRKSTHLQRELAGLPTFLARLKAQVAEITDEAQLHSVVEEAVGAIPGLLSGFAVYFGFLENGTAIRYRYASTTCSEQLRSGSCVLSLPEHPNCPTALAVDGRRYEAASGVQNPESGVVSLTAAPMVEGDFLVVPLVWKDRPVAVLACDTVLTNGGYEAWRSLELGSEARNIEEPERDFIIQVAGLLSSAWTLLAVSPRTPHRKNTDLVAQLRSQSPSAMKRGAIGLYESALSILGGFLDRPDLNLYISTPNRECDALTCAAQYCDGSLVRRNSADSARLHRRILGQQLLDTTAVSFELLSGSEESHRLVSNERNEARVLPFGGSGTKRDDWLLLVPVAVPFAKPLALLGIEGAASKPLSSALVETVHQVATEVAASVAALRKRTQQATAARQLVQWLEATTSLANIYVGVRDESGGVRYVAASKGQEFLVGQTLPSSEGVTGSFLASAEPVLRVPDLAARPDIKFWNPAKRGQRGEFALWPLAVPSGRYGILGCDTLGGGAGISEADFAAATKAAGIASDIFGDIDRGTADENTEGVSLAIEKLVGPGSVKFLKRVFVEVVKQLESLTKDQLMEMAHYKAPPSIIVKVVSATLVLLGHKPSTVNEWGECRPFIKQDLVREMAGFDPTKGGKKGAAFFIHSGKTLKGMTVEQVHQKGSLPASLCFQWSYASLQLRRAANALRKLADAGVDESTLLEGQEADEEEDAGGED